MMHTYVCNLPTQSINHVLMSSTKIPLLVKLLIVGQSKIVVIVIIPSKINAFQPQMMAKRSHHSSHKNTTIRIAEHAALHLHIMSVSPSKESQTRMAVAIKCCTPPPAKRFKYNTPTPYKPYGLCIPHGGDTWWGE